MTALADETARVWDAIGGQELARLSGHTDGLWSAVDDRGNAVACLKAVGGLPQHINEHHARRADDADPGDLQLELDE